MSKFEVQDIAEARGFTLWATINGNTLQFMDRFGINLFVKIDTAEFSLEWNIPLSIFSVKCPTCSPFNNEKHFDKIYGKFKNVIRAIVIG